MTDSSGHPASTSRDNPLFNDAALFDMYMNALNVVLSRPEIRQACDEFTLSPATLRMRMMRNAITVLKAAPLEFDAYQQATALKFPGLWVLVSGFLRLVTVWRHVDRGGVTGSDGP